MTKKYPRKKEWSQKYYANNKEEILKRKREKYHSLDPEYNKTQNKKYADKLTECGLPSWRVSDLKSNYGISGEEYIRILNEQKGVCKICSLPESVKFKGKIKLLCVDHDHKTGIIRGLLCSNCNKAIGLFQDNIEILQKAIKYLKND